MATKAMMLSINTKVLLEDLKNMLDWRRSCNVHLATITLVFLNTHLTEPKSKGQYTWDAWSQRSNFRYGNRKEILVESENVSTDVWVPFDRDSILGKSRKESSLAWLNTKHLSLTRQVEGGFLPQIGSSYQNLWVSMSDPLCAPTVVPLTGIYPLGLSFSDRS